MKSRGLAIAVLVLLILSGALYWSEHHKPSDDSTKASADTPPAILKLDQSSITRVELKKRQADPVIVAKSNSGEWQITQPKPLRADQTSVEGLLSTLSSLNSDRLVEDKASDLKTFGLEQPALEIQLTEKDNKSQTLVVGDDTPTGAVYTKLASDPRVFTIASYSKSSLDKTLNDLRDKRLLTITPDKVSRVELIKKDENIEFGRNKDDWQILRPKPLRADSVEVGDLVRKLTDAKMDLTGGGSNDAASAFSRGSQVATAKLTDVSGTQEIQLRKNQDNYYAKSSAVEGIYKTDADLGKEVEKKLDAFRNKKLFDFGYAQPDKVELHKEGQAWLLVRGTGGSDDWWWNGKKMDSSAVESLLSDIRDLTSAKFVDSGFSTPIAEVAVVSDSGKRSEKVLISKSGMTYVAKRENEPALYQIDSSAIDSLLKAADDLKPVGNQPQRTIKKP